MGLLIPRIGLLLWMLLSFGIVLLLLWRWGFPAVLRAVEGRRERIAAALEEAALALRQVDEARGQAGRIVEQARRDGGELLAQARAQGAAIMEEAREQARLQAARSAEQAENEADEIRRRAMSVAMDDIASLSVKIAGKVLQEELSGGGRQEKLIERLLERETDVPVNSL